MIKHAFLAMTAVVVTVLPKVLAQDVMGSGEYDAGYVLEDEFKGLTFFENFDFYDGADPTHGYVNYVNKSTAYQKGYVGQLQNGQSLYIGVDHLHTLDSNDPSINGRDSVRITSQQAWTHGLFIIDLAGMPGGQCGSWPALWMFGPDWPNSGEIDIIEGVNSQQENIMTLHTSPDCYMPNTNQQANVLTTSCDILNNSNSGCSSQSMSPLSYGTGFTSDGGGVYAVDWTSLYIRIYFFSRLNIPQDIIDGNPDPLGWGEPESNFEGTAGGCDIDSKFNKLNLVFDITFCGEWAGNAWSTDAECWGKANSCKEFVAGNPSEFVFSWWHINYIRIYQAQNTSASPTPSAVPTPTPSPHHRHGNDSHGHGHQDWNNDEDDTDWRTKNHHHHGHVHDDYELPADAAASSDAVDSGVASVSTSLEALASASAVQTDPSVIVAASSSGVPGSTDSPAALSTTAASSSTEVYSGLGAFTSATLTKNSTLAPFVTAPSRVSSTITSAGSSSSIISSSSISSNSSSLFSSSTSSTSTSSSTTSTSIYSKSTSTFASTSTSSTTLSPQTAETPSPLKMKARDHQNPDPAPWNSQQNQDSEVPLSDDAHWDDERWYTTVVTTTITTDSTLPHPHHHNHNSHADQYDPTAAATTTTSSEDTATTDAGSSAVAPDFWGDLKMSVSGTRTEGGFVALVTTSAQPTSETSNSGVINRGVKGMGVIVVVGLVVAGVFL